MKAALYKDLSDSCEYVEIESGKTIKENFPDVNFANRICIVNGDMKDADYVLKDSDLVVIRSIPHDMSGVSTGWRVVIGILTGGISEIINMGVEVYKNKQALAALEDLTSSGTSEVVSLPYIKNAPNSLATGKSQPYIIGKILFTPYILNGKTGSNVGFSTISGGLGQHQFYNAVLEGGFNKQSLDKVFCKNTVIKSFGGDTAQEGKFYLDTASSFASTDSFIEIAQDGNAFETTDFNRKIVEQVSGDQLNKHPADAMDDGTDEDDYEDLFFELEQNARAADICVMFNGLRYYTSSGSGGELTRHLKAEYSLDYAQLVADGDSDPAANATWTQFYFVTADHHDAVKVRHTQRMYFDTKYTDHPYDMPENINIWDYMDTWKYFGGEKFDVKKGMNLEILYTSHLYANETGRWTRDFRVFYDEITQEEYDVEHSAKDTETDTSKFTGNYSTQVRFNAHVDFTYDQVKDLTLPVTIRLSTPDRYIEDGSTTDDTYVEWIHSYCYNVKKSKEAGAFVNEKVIEDTEAALSTLIGLHIESTKANEEKLDSIQIITNGMAPIWDSTAGAFTSDKYPTSNVASWLWEVLTSDIHAASKVEAEELDEASFGELYTYCENNNLQANMVLTEGQTKQSVLESLCTLGNCSLYQNIYGKIAVAIDTVKSNAVAILNNNNIISFSYDKDMTREVDGYLISYTNAREDFVSDTALIMADGKTRTADSVITEQTVKGITDYNQLYKYARRLIAKNKLQPKTCTAEVGQEGVFYTPYSKVLVQHPSLAIGLGYSEIKSVIYSDDAQTIIGLNLYDPVGYDSTKESGFGMVIQCVGSNYCRLLNKAYTANTDGRVSTVYFNEGISINETTLPHAHDILSFGYLNDGEFDTITSPMLITGIDRNDNGVVLTLKDYNEAIYETGTIPEYETNVTQQQVYKDLSIEDSVSAADLEETKASAINNSIPVSITQYWAAWNSNVNPPTAYSTDPSSETATLTPTLKYLWNYEINTYADGRTVQSGAPAVVGVYGDKGESGSGYILDLSPEQISLLNTTISDTGAAFNIKASFFLDSTDLHSATTFTATVNDVEVGTWTDTVDGKMATIPCSVLSQTSDITTIIVKAVYGDVTRTAIATVTKVYSGQDAVIYKMLFSATKIREDNTGTKTPDTIEVEKRKVNANGESETQKGYITVSIDDGDEITTSTYINQAQSDYDSSKVYYEKVAPFFLYTDSNKNFVLGNGVNPATASVVGGVFYN